MIVNKINVCVLLQIYIWHPHVPSFIEFHVFSPIVLINWCYIYPNKTIIYTKLILTYFLSFFQNYHSNTGTGITPYTLHQAIWQCFNSSSTTLSLQNSEPFQPFQIVFIFNVLVSISRFALLQLSYRLAACFIPL